MPSLHDIIPLLNKFHTGQIYKMLRRTEQSDGLEENTNETISEINKF